MKNKNSPPESRPKSSEPDRIVEQQTRRSFLSQLGLGATLLGIGGQIFMFFRSLIPNVLYEEPRRFKIGTPDQFNEGVQFLEDSKLFIFREKNTFHAVSAICSHLGCTVKMQKLNQPKKIQAGGREFIEHAEFKCPCHGSKYYGDGTNYEGPAPRPLAYFKLEVSPEDGELIVDMTNTVGRDFRLTV